MCIAPPWDTAFTVIVGEAWLQCGCGEWPVQEWGQSVRLTILPGASMTMCTASEDLEREIAWVYLLRGIGRNHQLSFLSNSKLRSSCASFPVRYRATNRSDALLMVRPMTEFRPG